MGPGCTCARVFLRLCGDCSIRHRVGVDAIFSLDVWHEKNWSIDMLTMVYIL